MSERLGLMRQDRDGSVTRFKRDNAAQKRGVVVPLAVEPVRMMDVELMDVEELR